MKPAWRREPGSRHKLGTLNLKLETIIN